MTHDELLDKILGHYKKLLTMPKYAEWAELNMHPHTKALRAVVELHKPLFGTTLDTCSECKSDNLCDYPCTTIQAIEKELK